MLPTLLIAFFCLGFLVGRIVPDIARRIRAYLYVPRVLAPYQFPVSSNTSDPRP